MSPCTSPAQRKEKKLLRTRLFFPPPTFLTSVWHLSPGATSYTTAVADLDWGENARVFVLLGWRSAASSTRAAAGAASAALLALLT